ncbi:MAG: type II toxin-antitoxin system HicB family antitoxin [Planctomycetia bacterium]|nr:type II toxin-antitoxin system HicB family antitoxin [Planctomycetia bacterium]
MLRFDYPAVFILDYKCGDGSVGVYFPDLPGCVTIGDDYAHAISQAKEVLALHLRGMILDGEEIPEPSPVGKVEAVPISIMLEDGDLRRSSPDEVDAAYQKILEEENEDKARFVSLDIPSSLYEAARDSGIDVRGVVEKALRHELQVEH